jgi:ribosomal protein L12E/L44/L45/RPP1/RPP2
MAANKIPQFLNATELVECYPTLTASTFRDQLSTFVTDHVYLNHKILEKENGPNPFPATQWQSWDNLILDKPAVSCPEKVKVQKTRKVGVVDEKTKKPVIDPKTGKQKQKTEKIPDQFEEKEKRLRKITTFNAAGKSGLTFPIVSFVHETVMAAPKITKSDDSTIRDAIESVEDCEYRVAPVIFSICNQWSDASIKAALPKTNGNLETKLNTAVEKVVEDSNIRHVLVSSIMKFLRIFTIRLASNLWNETKEVKEKKEKKKDEDDEDDDDEEDEDDDTKDEKNISGKGTTTSDKQIRQELLFESQKLEGSDDKLTGEFFLGMDEFAAALAKADNKKKAENKKKREENKKKKDAEEAAKKAAAAEATNESDDEEPEEEIKIKPKKGKKKVEEAADEADEAADEEDEVKDEKPKKGKKKVEEPKEDDKPVEVEAAAAPAARRRRNAPK